ncbi:hypothetical protein Bca4012_082791 [Brassica carinata]
MWLVGERTIVGSKTCMAFGSGVRLFIGAEFPQVQMAIFLHHLVTYDDFIRKTFQLYFKSNMWTSLIAPYLFFSLPLVVFQFLRGGEFGKWITLLTVVLRLFLPNHFPESLEIPGVTLIASAPTFLVETFSDEADDLRDPSIVCLLTSCYLLSKHTKACGAYKTHSFVKKKKSLHHLSLSSSLYLPLWSAFTYAFLNF